MIAVIAWLNCGAQMCLCRHVARCLSMGLVSHKLRKCGRCTELEHKKHHRTIRPHMTTTRPTTTVRELPVTEISRSAWYPQLFDDGTVKLSAFYPHSFVMQLTNARLAEKYAMVTPSYNFQPFHSGTGCRKPFLCCAVHSISLRQIIPQALNQKLKFKLFARAFLNQFVQIDEDDLTIHWVYVCSFHLT